MTILELLITMALLGIVAALALPSMMDGLGRSSARAATRSFTSALSLARSEAVKTGSGVSICPSLDGEDCAAGWGTTGGNVLPPGVSALPGTDMFRVWGADPVVDAIVNSVSPGAATVVNVNANAGVAINDILLISDCEVADLVQACNVQQIGNPGTLNLVLSAGCTPGNVASMRLLSGPGSRVMRLGGTIPTTPLVMWTRTADQRPWLTWRCTTTTSTSAPCPTTCRPRSSTATTSNTW